MLGFNAFDAAQCTLAGVALIYMLKKGEMGIEEEAQGLTPANSSIRWPRNPSSRPG